MPPPPPHRLIIFTRYPIPGAAKTRLIPRLGAEGAAEMQRQMTERLVRRARELSDHSPLSLEVRFEGGDATAMRQWLGEDLIYRPQSEGDLGERLDHALRESFAEGHEKALVVGSDIPDLTGEIMGAAFQGLDSHDLTIGPAADGGYYLIGLKRPAPDLFRDIPWGTETVHRRTLEKARALGLSVHSLQTLRDLDRPEDLEIWEESASTYPNIPPSPSTSERISVIIPTLNEADNIGPTLEKVWKNQKEGLLYSNGNPLESKGALEVVVIDGGSSDQTLAIARAQGARVASCEPGRGTQMNAGAAVAKGDILLFLHADSLLPENYDEALREALARPGVAAGAFRFGIDAEGSRYRRLERLVNCRAKYLKMPYGDQGIFLRASLFHEMGGYGDLPVLEDFDLIRRLKRHGGIARGSRTVLTSPRRWREIGIFRAICLNLLMVAGYYTGVSPERLARLYYGKKRT